jgi:hypothetical protein
MTKRRTEITVETERLLVAHRRRTTRVWCVRCGLEVETSAGFEDNFPNGFAPGDAQQPARATGTREREHGVEEAGEDSPEI